MTDAIKTRTRTVRGEHTTGTRPARRGTLSGDRFRLSIEGKTDPDFHYKIVNDYRNDIARHLEAGFEFVGQSEGIRLGQKGVDLANLPGDRVAANAGDGIVAYLMKQPNEFWEEDKAIFNKRDDDRERDLKRELNSKDEGRYGSVDFERSDR